MAPIEAATAGYSERGWPICRTCAESEAAARIQSAPYQGSLSRRWWTVMGLSPAVLYFALTVLAYSFGASLIEYVIRVPVLNGLLVGYWTFMPVFALGWLVALTWDRPTICFRDGSSVKRIAYVLRFLGVNIATWLFLFFRYNVMFGPH